MSQNFDGYRGTPLGSPPPHANNDFSGLMGSLISPGLNPPNPLQQVFNNMPYYNAPSWHNGGQGSFNYSVPFQDSPVNQDAWNQSGGGGYTALGQTGEEGEDDDHDSLMVVDDTDILKNLRSDHQLSQGGAPPNPAQPTNPFFSSSMDPPHPNFHGSTGPALGLVTKSPIVNDSAARAAELRAKLLAKRPSTTASPRASPATNKAELPNATQINAQELPQSETRKISMKAEDDTKYPALHKNAAAEAEEVSTIKAREQSQGQPVKDDEFEHLFAQARNAANTIQSDSNLSNGDHDGAANPQKSADPPNNDLDGTKPVISDIRPPLQKVASSSEMSEGEIHSGPSSPTVPRPFTNLSETKESNEVEQENNEKLMRQDGVSKAYQPLQTFKQPTTNPGKAGPQTLDHSRAEPLPSPKLSNKQLKQQAWKQRNGYAGSHGFHADSRRDRDGDRDRYLNGKDDEKGSRRSSTSQAAGNPSQVEREARRRPSDDELRRLQRTEDNARRAAEYKRNLEAQRIAASKKTSDNFKASSPTEARRQETDPRTSHTPKRVNDRDDLGSAQSRIDTQMPTIESTTGEQNTDTVMTSPTGQTTEEDEDISDWLELTEYYDIAHRERRLTWFRKKRALDIQRAELEQEEQLELQERSMLKRAQSVLPTTTPPKVTRRASVVHAKMPPPPLPIREANNVGIKIKDAALSAGSPISQTPTTALKRAHPEDDLDSRRTQPADKIARTDLNGHAANEKPLTSPTSVKGEGRGDRYIPRQGRSRSPGSRRRSLSPRRQRHSRSPSPYGYRIPAIPRYLRTCHNCNQPGHAVGECPEPRRDGKEWNRQNDYQQWVSPNYRGRNPVPVIRGGGNRSPHHPRGGGAGNRSRYDSIGRSEDGETVGARESIGSASAK